METRGRGVLDRPVKPYDMHTSLKGSTDALENPSLFNVASSAPRPVLSTLMVI
jgi:hypothetical protein